MSTSDSSGSSRTENSAGMASAKISAGEQALCQHSGVAKRKHRMGRQASQPTSSARQQSARHAPLSYFDHSRYLKKPRLSPGCGVGTAMAPAACDLTARLLRCRRVAPAAPAQFCCSGCRAASLPLLRPADMTSCSAAMLCAVRRHAARRVPLLAKGRQAE